MVDVNAVRDPDPDGGMCTLTRVEILVRNVMKLFERLQWCVVLSMVEAVARSTMKVI